MTKINLFTNISFLLIVIICAISQCSGVLSNKQLCYDPKCSVPISLGKTVLKYYSKDTDLLSFETNVNVKVFSKDAGKRKDVWGVEINGKRGFAPKTFIKEYKILQKDLNHEVPVHPLPKPTNTSSDNKVQPVEETKNFNTVQNSESPNVQVDASDVTLTEEELPQALNGISPSFNVIDGTTIHLEENEPSVQPSSVTKVVQTTIAPSQQEGVINIKPEISSSSEKIESSVSEKPEASVEETADAADEKSEKEDTSDEIGIDNFGTSSEEIIDLPEITGIEIPLAGVNTKLESDALQKEKLETESAENTDAVDRSDHPDKSDGKVAEPLEIPINLPEATASHRSKDVADAKDVKEAVIVSVTKDAPTVENKAGEPSESSKESTGVSDNVKDTEKEKDPIIEKEKEKDSVELNTNESETLENVGISDVNSTESSSKKLDSNALVESELKETGKVALTDANAAKEEKLVPESIVHENILKDEATEKIVPKDAEHGTTEEPRSSDILEGQALNVGTDDGTLKWKKSILYGNMKIAEKPTVKEELQQESREHTEKEKPTDAIEATITNDTLEASTATDTTETNATDVNITVNTTDNLIHDSAESSDFMQQANEKADSAKELLYSSQESMISDDLNINQFHNRNLLNVEQSEHYDENNADNLGPLNLVEKTLPEDGVEASNEDKVLHESINPDDSPDDTNPDAHVEETTLGSIFHEVQVSPPDVCTTDECTNINENAKNDEEDDLETEQSATMNEIKLDRSHWTTFLYLTLTAVTTLVFSLGYYYIENMRRDGKLIGKINKLEKDLLIATTECTMLTENWKSTKDKLTCIEDESFGSNEMVLSLKADLEASQKIRAELEDHVAMLEKDLETATEAGLELEGMLREVLSSNSEVNPLAQSIEDLQARLNAQQAANESITNALNLKSQENESLAAEFAALKTKYEELQVELTRVTENLKLEVDRKKSIEDTLTDKVHRLEMKLQDISTEKTVLLKECKSKEVEVKDLVDVINQFNSNNLDLDKLLDVSHIKADATSLLEENMDLKVRLSEAEGAHDLLQEHVKLIKEEINTLSEQCKSAEKEKKDAETRLEVLTNFFNEKETQRQKEEAVWLQKQGEVVSTVERIQTMQNEIENYKQQVEMLKREIVDQEREYKGQISHLEMKAHEQWVVARQVERRLEESKTEAGELRNRLTMIEKNINDVDSDAKLHRLEANGETATSPPLFLGAESSSSPIMFTGSSGVPPPPPPSYMHSLFHPYLLPPLPTTSGVPPFEVGQRPPPLGGRLSSPPPMPLHPPAPSRYDNAGSPPPPMSPHIFAPYNHHRSPPPPFGSDHIHHPHPPPPGSILPPPLGSSNSWGEESLPPPPRNSGFHPHQREQRVRNHKGSLHSSGESLDKTHHSSKV